MADIDLDKLSNNEIRLKCIELNLANVPVTDSSRRIIIKRLRDAINNAGKETTITKTTNRRETINITKTAPPEVELPKSRRTISAATVVSTKEENSNAATGIPISTRRRSVQKEPAEVTKSAKAVSKTMPTILIEDDEDDFDLLNAVENAEKESTTSTIPIENIPTRRKSRSISKAPEIISTATTEATKKRAMTPLTEENFETDKRERVSKNINTTRAKTVDIVSVETLSHLSAKLTESVPNEKVEPSLNRHNIRNTTPSVYSTPSAVRSSVPITTTSSKTSKDDYMSYSLSSYRTKYTTESILNELSDNDAQNDDGTKSPFLSSFVRDLERRRSVGRSTLATSPYERRTGKSNYDSYIRGRRSSKADVSFGQAMIALNRKYKLKIVFCVLAVLCLSIFTYIRINS